MNLVAGHPCVIGSCRVENEREEGNGRSRGYWSGAQTPGPSAERFPGGLSVSLRCPSAGRRPIALGDQTVCSLLPCMWLTPDPRSWGKAGDFSVSPRCPSGGPHANRSRRSDSVLPLSVHVPNGRPGPCGEGRGSLGDSAVSIRRTACQSLSENGLCAPYFRACG